MDNVDMAAFEFDAPEDARAVASPDVAEKPMGPV